MNCHEAMDALEMYIAGDLDESDSLDVAAHLATCDGCAAEYERLRTLIGGMRGIAESFVPVERFVAPAPATVARRGGWGWRVATAAAALLAAVSVSALTVPALARQLPVPLASEIERLEGENAALQEEVDELTVRLETVGGEEVPIVDTTPGDLPAEVNTAVQTLAMEFVRAQYAGDLEALAAMGTDRLKADIEAHPEDYLRAQGAEIVFAQMTEAAQTDDGTYLVFVRLSDSEEWTDSQYQEDFEIVKEGDRYLVDFMGMDA